MFHDEGARRRARPLTTLALQALVALSIAAAPPPAPAVAAGPAELDFADPFVLREGDTYYAFATTARGNNIPAARSRDLASWELLPDALPALPKWAAPTRGLTWAPSVLRRPRGYVLYYTLRDAASGFQCLSRALAERPEGPYVDDSSRAFVCQVGGATPLCGSIDPSPFVDEDGRAYLLWKSDENAAPCRTPSRLWSQALADDGLDVIGAPTPLLTMDRTWEKPLVEGPSMVAHEGQHYLFYSANWYESADYAIGYATCESPLGPCTKATVDAPLVRSAGALLGPGGQELFTDAAGDLWMTFHAWTAPKTTYAEGGARALRFARVTFTDGLPVVTAANTSL